MRKLGFFALKALVSIALIAVLLHGMDLQRVAAQLGAVDLGSVALAVIVTTAISVFHALRWHIVLGRLGHALPFPQSLRLVLVGYFFNQTLPSTIGGDAFRAWGAYKSGIPSGAAVTSVVVDRIYALVALVVMIGGGSWWLFDVLRTGMPRMLVMGLVAGTVTGLYVLLSVRRMAGFLRRWRIGRMVLVISEGARAVAARATFATAVIGLTIAGYAAVSYSVHVLALGLGVRLTLGNSMLLIPLVTLITVLPVSIAGWGLRETAMVVALSLIGVDRAHAFSLSVLYGLVIMASGIPGGLIWVALRQRNMTPILTPDTTVR